MRPVARLIIVLFTLAAFERGLKRALQSAEVGEEAWFWAFTLGAMVDIALGVYVWIALGTDGRP